MMRGISLSFWLTALCAAAPSTFAIEWITVDSSSFADEKRRTPWPGNLDTIWRAQDSPYDEPLATDRPDFTEASSTVGLRVLQIETGYTFVHDDSGGTRTRSHNLPEAVVRYGILDNVELRLVWNYVWEDTTTGGITESVDGAEDMLLGAKFGLTTQNELLPETALILHVSTPTGATPFTNRHTEFELNYCYGWDLPGDKYLAGSFGYSTATQVHVTTLPLLGNAAIDHHNIFHASVTHGFPVMESVTVYVEYFGLYVDGLSGGRPQHYLDGGPIYLVNDNLQLDLRLGIGLNEASDNLFAGTGLSVRF